MQQSFLARDGVLLSYAIPGGAEKGDGQRPTLVLLHGFAVNADLVWGQTGLASIFSKDFHVVLLDLRGHGQSSRPEATSAYGLRMVDDVCDLLDHLGVERAFVFGYSMGGKIALKFMDEYPDRVVSLCLAGTGLSSAASRAIYDSLTERLSHCSEGISISESLYGTDTVLPPDVADLINSNSVTALRSIVENWEAWCVGEAALERCQIPVFGVIGEDDAFVGEFRRLMEVLPMGTGAVLSGCGHTDILLDEAARNAVVGFLQKFLRENY